MSQDFSKAALLRYLDAATRQGKLNVHTASGLKAAALRLLEDVGDDQDVRNVDVDAVAIQYHNKHPDGDVSTDSLLVYKKRLARLISDFTQFVANPFEFKPKSRALSKPGEKANGRANPKSQEKDADTGFAVAPTPASSPMEAAATRTLLSLPYPLRADLEARVIVPRDITSEEAKRLCAFIVTLAADFKPAG